MLSVVPGISTTMARSLLAAYGSLAAVAAAAPEGLRRHPGNSPKRFTAGTSRPSTASWNPRGPLAGRDQRAAGSSLHPVRAQNFGRSIVEQSHCAPCTRLVTVRS
jgi:hypothetical protein